MWESKMSSTNKLFSVAKSIAEEANKCCHRSDGYEEDLVKFIEDKIASIMCENEKMKAILECYVLEDALDILGYEKVASSKHRLDSE